MKRTVFNGKFGFIISCCVIFFLVSCASLPEDLVISSATEEELMIIDRVAQDVAKLDGSHILGNTDIMAAAQVFETIQVGLENPNLSAQIRSQLIAYRGRVSLILGDTIAAKADYQEASSLNKGDLQAEILALRLGLIENVDSIVVGRAQQPYITLERALANYRSENYLAAAAQFDEAFISLDDSYRQAYGELREKAWQLRDISSSTDKDIREILKQDSITLAQMIAIIQGQGDLLYKYTGSKAVEINKALRQLKTQGLFYSINSWTDVDALTKETVLTRSLAARFLWNLYNDRRGTLGNPPRYSHQFVSMGSPIQDVPLNCPDFDAILGCIEREFMELPDGINFYPESPMSGRDFSESIRKIR